VSVAIGLAGAGRRAAQVHAPYLASTPEIRFSGIWGRTPEAARRLAAQYDVTAYTRYGDLLDHCDAVSFAVPPAVQTFLAGAAAQKGRAVLLEKPIAGDLAGAEELAREVAAGGVVSQVALTWRYTLPVREFLTNAVPRTRPLGGVGRILSGALTTAQAGQPPVQAWRLERGVLLDQGPDLVDLLDAALGRVIGVRAHGDPLGWVGLLIEHAGGRFSEASLCACADVEPPQAGVEVFGPGGTAVVDCAGAVGDDSYATMFDEFAAAVEHGTPHALDVDRGLRLQEILDNAETDLFASS
jgi:predicted dehydrogenase